ncbi:MAG: T9SS type A sorting domain-containing protein, partial [Bacteroidota bacterium]
AASGNQWYYNGTAIAGATGQTYTVTHNTGYYWVVVTLNGCSSDISNKVYIEVVGVEELPEVANFTVYPVPNNGIFTTSVEYPVETTFNIYIFNQLGAKIYELKDMKTTHGKYQRVIDLKSIPAGIYSVVFLNSEFKVVRKVVVNN